MDPAVGVEHILGYVLGVDAVNGISDVLSSRHYQTERDQYDDGDGIVESEDSRVDVDIVDFDQVLESPKHVQHRRTTLQCLASAMDHISMITQAASPTTWF